MAKPSKLANPNSFAVRDALTRTCPLCESPEGKLCVTRAGRPLPGVRKVHYQCAKFRDIDATTTPTDRGRE